MSQTRRQFVLQAAAAGIAVKAQAQSLLRDRWSAQWIAVPGAPATESGVYHFRRTVDLDARPERFVVHASGDNRYQLFVNGQRVAWGPARGDLFHWRYETVDVSGYLKRGRNVFAAVVWNYGELAAEAQITLRSGFVLQGDSVAERIVDTGTKWKCLRDEAYTPLEVQSRDVRGYFAAGPCDRMVAAKHPWQWAEPDFDDSTWPAAIAVTPAAGREASDVHSRWMLVPRTIPAMEERAERLQKLRGATGIAAPLTFPARPERIQIPPRTTATLLLDQTWLTTAYPELTVNGGKDALVRLSYAEALFQGRDKGHRDDVEGKTFVGYHDEFVADGGARRTFRPLWWRTYRYLQISVETRDEALEIADLHATAVGYPFVRKAEFDAGEPQLNRILDVGWRTARLCAHETYMDCPYYEQLQYVGDARVQCLVSLFQTGDARLMRNAIELINDSRQSDGCTMSRYPTRLEQYIPGFALWWIGMVHDYWWYVNDPATVRRMLPGVRAVLSFFEAYQKENGSLASLPWWRYLDWVPGWPSGNAPQEPDGSAAAFDLLLLMGYRWAANLEDSLGLGALAQTYRGRETQLRTTAQQLYWSDERKLYADTPRKVQFSQHTNILAVLADVVTGEEARAVALRALDQPGLAQAALFFKYYQHVALAKVGEGDRYLDQLGDWRGMLDIGLTTFAEVADRPGAPARSDCHAWSASPNIEMLRTVLGVDSAAPGFARVRVQPHLGKLKFARGKVPHPKGEIAVSIEAREARIVLPSGITGEFVWSGKTHELQPGENRVSLA